MIRINPLFFIVLFVVYKLNLLNDFLLVFFVSISHELGHLFCAVLMKQNVDYFKIQPWGICMKCNNFSSLKVEFLVSASGPLINFAYIIIAVIIKHQLFFVANLFMLIINLLPIYPLDGGRIFSSFLRNEINRSNADIILRFTSSFLAIILLLTGFYLFYKTKINFSVILASLFICLTTESVIDKNDTVEFKKVKHYCAKDTDCASIILKNKNKKDNIIIDILNENHCYLGSISGREVLEEIAISGYEIKFGEILRKHLLYQGFCSTI